MHQRWHRGTRGQRADGMAAKGRRKGGEAAGGDVTLRADRATGDRQRLLRAQREGREVGVKRGVMKTTQLSVKPGAVRR